MVTTGEMLWRPNKQYPLDHKLHPLHKCRGFRAMVLHDCEKILKDNAICFRGCTSTVHRAKDFDMVVKCTECDSQRRVSALPPGPGPQLPMLYPPSKEQGREKPQ